MPSYITDLTDDILCVLQDSRCSYMLLNTTGNVTVADHIQISISVL